MMYYNKDTIFKLSLQLLAQRCIGLSGKVTCALAIHIFGHHFRTVSDLRCA